MKIYTTLGQDYFPNKAPNNGGRKKFLRSFANSGPNEYLFISNKRYNFLAISVANVINNLQL
jgi:hypothetical protein